MQTVLTLGLVIQSGSAAAAALLQCYTYLSGDAAAATPLQDLILFVLPGEKLQCGDEGVSFSKREAGFHHILCCPALCDCTEHNTLIRCWMTSLSTGCFESSHDLLHGFESVGKEKPSSKRQLSKLLETLLHD